MNAAHLLTDPARVLWDALGQPRPHGAPMNKTGLCARCGTAASDASRVKVVVSDKFTGWADYTHTPDPLWCVPCAWAHTAVEARTRAWRITDGAAVEATTPIVRDELAAPLPLQVALIVPLSRHKHILPTAKWGHVTTDDRTLLWTAAEADRFRTVLWLRHLGFNESALSDPTPRFEHLSTLDGPTMQRVLDQWATLAAWRHDDTYLKVACVGARTKKGTMS
jgi:hypothetical protein